MWQPRRGGGGYLWDPRAIDRGLGFHDRGKYGIEAQIPQRALSSSAGPERGKGGLSAPLAEVRGSPVTPEIPNGARTPQAGAARLVKRPFITGIPAIAPDDELLLGNC